MDINDKSKLIIGIGSNPDPERVIEHSVGQRPTLTGIHPYTIGLTTQ